MLKHIFRGLFVLLIAVSLSAPRAYAHVLVTDKQSSTSAIVHITPDDDPEAGKIAEFYYELETKVNYNTFSDYRLYITDENNQTTQVPLNTTTDSIAAQYTFPTQGFYKLELKSSNPRESSFDLRYSLRVSRGVVGGASMTKQYTWSQSVLLAVGISALLLAITFFNNRKAIARHSSFK